MAYEYDVYNDHEDDSDLTMTVWRARRAETRVKMNCIVGE
jgi:hypothetical protein